MVSLQRTLLFLAVIVLAACAPSPGKSIFERERCIECHSFKGRGGAAGPDLTAVHKRHDDAWIRDKLRMPQAVLPHSAMPSYRHLSDEEMQALIDYLKE
ncbi:MAG: cytochrome c [Nitrospirota bacterium]